MLISVHLPKTAGTSFGITLETHFTVALLKDYADLPINTPKYERNKAALESSLHSAARDFSEIQCIHGHFLPLKYLLLATKRDVKFVTWMRNPVDRAISHYNYWRNDYNPKSAPSVRQKMVEEDWSLERFCLGPEIRNLYSQFLWGFPVEYFNFIGVSEFFEDDLQYFARHYLGVSPKSVELNVGNKQSDRCHVDTAFRKKIEAFHEQDMDLYRRACERRLTERLA